jgi:hypothetical protein
MKKLSKYSLELYNAQGVMVKPVETGYASGNKLVEWDARKYPTGIYFVKLITEAGVEVKRIVIQQ